MRHFRHALNTLLLMASLIAWLPGHASAEIWRRPLWMENGKPIVDVWIGSRGPYRFLVDTGAEGTTIARDVSGKLALPVLGAVEQHTVTGVTRLLMVRIEDFRLGPRGPVTSNLPVTVSDLRVPREAIHALDGVLGTDVLGSFDYLLDYKAGRLLLARGETLPTRGGVALPLQLDRQRPMVSWPHSSSGAAGTPLLLVVDSGADSLIVDATAPGFTCRRRTEQPATLDTHAGRRDVLTCEVEPLRAGDLAVEGVRLVRIEWPTTIARLERGLLPASAFGRVYVSASQGTVRFWER